MTLRYCTVENNSAGTGAGYYGHDYDIGRSISLDLHDSTVANNTSGGVQVSNGATVTVHGTSAICGNTGGQCAGFSNAACQAVCPA